VLPRLATDRLRRRPDCATPADTPLVVVERRANALLLASVDAAAAASGLAPGMALASARAVCPGVAVAEADPAADAAQRDAVADWAERYTPFVGLDGADGLVLDIGGSAHLFGGEAALMADLLARTRRAGFTAMAAIAGTRAAAVALARFAPQAAAAGLAVPPGGEAAATAPLPAAALGLDGGAAAALRRVGLTRIGDLAARPRGPLAARFGSGLVDALDAVTGRVATPLSPRRALPACLAERRFAEPIGHAADVERSILALASDLAAILERRGEGARRLELVFFRSDGALRRIALATGRPLREPAAVLRLYAEKLDALADPLDPGFGFDVIRLAALATERLDPAQAGLAGGDEAEALAALADQLAARFGPGRVLRIAAGDSHWPERAAAAVPVQRGPAGPADWSDWTVPGEPPARPIRLFDPPEPVEALAEVPDGPPIRFRWRRVLHEVRRAEGPERIAPEWWRSGAPALSRDYFRVEDAAGRRFWVYREGLWGRETVTPRWYLHGLFA